MKISRDEAILLLTDLFLFNIGKRVSDQPIKYMSSELGKKNASRIIVNLEQLSLDELENLYNNKVVGDTGDKNVVKIIRQQRKVLCPVPRP